MMTPENYRELLWRIQVENPPKTSITLAPDSQRIYNIDLDTREVEAPEWLSVRTDHRAEIVYFKVKRFYDNIDLADMNCIVQFVNAEGKSGLYVIPCYDIVSYGDLITENGDIYKGGEILLPWCIQGLATAVAGDIQFSFQFYKLEPTRGEQFWFILNTLPVTSKILQGNDFDGAAVSEAIESQLGITMQALRDIGAVKDYINLLTEAEKNLSIMSLVTDGKVPEAAVENLTPDQRQMTIKQLVELNELVDFNLGATNVDWAYRNLIEKINAVEGQLNLYWYEP